MIPVHQRFAKTGGIYLAPSGSAHLRRLHGPLLGQWETPRCRPGRWTLKAGSPWAYDNDAFNDKWDFNTWARGLIQRRPYQNTCLFVTIPDVVADYTNTLAQFHRYAPLVRQRGWPIALVTQDGLTPPLVPWPQIHALFIGGTDQHKLGPEAGALIAEALRRHKWVHVGRVNSQKRILQFWRAHSWDGTTVCYEPALMHRLAPAIRQARAMKHHQLTLPTLERSNPKGDPHARPNPSRRPQ